MAPCGAEVWGFMVVNRVTEVDAMLPIVGGIWW